MPKKSVNDPLGRRKVPRREKSYGHIMTVHIDPTLHREVKVAAAREGLRMCAWVVDAIKDKMARATA